MPGTYRFLRRLRYRRRVPPENVLHLALGRAEPLEYPRRRLGRENVASPASTTYRGVLQWSLSPLSKRIRVAPVSAYFLRTESDLLTG